MIKNLKKLKRISKVIIMLVFLPMFLVIVHLRNGEVVRFKRGEEISVGRTNGGFGEKKIWFIVWGKGERAQIPPKIAIFPMDEITYAEVVEK